MGHRVSSKVIYQLAKTSNIKFPPPASEEVAIEQVLKASQSWKKIKMQESTQRDTFLEQLAEARACEGGTKYETKLRLI